MKGAVEAMMAGVSFFAEDLKKRLAGRSLFKWSARGTLPEATSRKIAKRPRLDCPT
jgi:hypothetical protein